MPFHYTCATCGGDVLRPQRIKQGHRAFCSGACRGQGQRRRVSSPCEACGQEWERPASHADGRFCSRDCYEASRSNAVTKTCPACGQDFTVSRGSIAYRYTACSYACRTVNTMYLKCERCGTPFTGKPNGPYRYCSEECRRPPRLIECRHCEVEFRVIPSDTDRQFCSFRCYRAFEGETIPERLTREALDHLGIEYLQEHPVGRRCIDFALPALGIALEVDGVYWHDAERDLERDTLITAAGWKIVRVTDVEIISVEDVPALLRSRLG